MAGAYAAGVSVSKTAVIVLLIIESVFGWFVTFLSCIPNQSDLCTYTTATIEIHQQVYLAIVCHCAASIRCGQHPWFASTISVAHNLQRVCGFGNHNIGECPAFSAAQFPHIPRTKQMCFCGITLGQFDCSSLVWICSTYITVF